MTLCSLCAGPTQELWAGTVLGRHPVTYRRCTDCGSVLLLEPDWLEEAYSSAISQLDVGLLERCRQLANVTTAVLTAQHLGRGDFLDFGGGYGTLTRMMRDRGYRFHHLDPYCRNMFAAGLESDLARRWDAVTAFEVLEHLPDPVSTLRAIMDSTDVLLTTTQVLPSPTPAPGAWAYYSPESGQHITLYTVKGLQAVAERLGVRLTTSGRLVHAFHRGRLRRSTRAVLHSEPMAYVTGSLLSEARRRRSLIEADSEAIAAALVTGVERPPAGEAPEAGEAGDAPRGDRLTA